MLGVLQQFGAIHDKYDELMTNDRHNDIVLT